MTASPSIFVLIPSYRDPECQWTVNDLFEKAVRPARIRVGICWQAEPEEDESCFEVETRPEQVDVIYFHPEESRGVGWARAQAQTLLRNEDYALQIDSHMRFVRGWDERMLTLLAQCDAPRPLLTVYPPGYTPPDQLDLDPQPRVQCISRFDNAGVLYFGARRPPTGVWPKTPMPTACFASGFVFGDADWMRAVPHDPDIYFKDEHALAARLWTHGFDLFSPHETLIYHYYQRKESAKPWRDDPNWSDKYKKSLLRLRQLLTPSTLPERDRIDLGKHGLGRERSLVDYEAYAGVSLSARSIASYARSFPYVRTDAVAAELLSDREMAVSEQAALFVVDDEGLLFSAARGEIYRLNTAATYVWCRLEDGASWDELVAGLSNFCRISAADAEATLANLVVHWRGQGVLRGNEADSEEEELAPSREDLPEGVDKDAVSFPASPPVQREQHYRVLGSCFCVQFCELEQSDWLMPALTHFEVSEDREADHVITVYEEGGRHHIFRDQELVHTDMLISQLAPFVKHQLVRTALDVYDHILNLHAGAVSKNGALIALPAQSGGGKSTGYSKLHSKHKIDPTKRLPFISGENVISLEVLIIVSIGILVVIIVIVIIDGHIK